MKDFFRKDKQRNKNVEDFKYDFDLTVIMYSPGLVTMWGSDYE